MESRWLDCCGIKGKIYKKSIHSYFWGFLFSKIYLSFIHECRCMPLYLPHVLTESRNWYWIPWSWIGIRMSHPLWVVALNSGLLEDYQSLLTNKSSPSLHHTSESSFLGLWNLNATFSKIVLLLNCHLLFLEKKQ